MACLRDAQRLRSEAGFNLIEVMVCLAIIGVLVSIAAPTYLGAIARADDVAAHASLHLAQVAGRQLAGDASGYAAANLAGLGEIESSIEWVDENEASRGPTVVSRAVVGEDLLLASYSPTGTCWFLRDHPDRGVARASTVGVERADCTAMRAVGLTFAPTW